MYENQTQEQILGRMLENISDEIDKREGSVARDLLSPKSIELAQIYLELDNVLQFGFASTTYGEFLDRKALEAGIYRLPASKSYGVVKLTGEEGIEIPLGSVFYTDSGIQFQTMESAVIPSNGTISVMVESVNEGAVNNVAANSIVNSTVNDVSVTNENITTGGTDIESDSRLLQRYQIQVQRAANSGSMDNYKQWALENPSVGIVNVIPTHEGGGTVKVIILSENKDILPPEILNAVYNHIESVRPIGATVTVATGVELPIDISCTISLADGVTIEQAETAIKSNISAYLKQATLEEPDIKISKIITSIMGTGAVLDYSNLLVNGDTINIPLNSDSIAKLGTVTITT